MGNINKSIKCRVDSCKHHDTTEYCLLNSIIIGGQCSDCNHSKDTECRSFERRK